MDLREQDIEEFREASSRDFGELLRRRSATPDSGLLDLLLLLSRRLPREKRPPQEDIDNLRGFSA